MKFMEDMIDMVDSFKFKTFSFQEKQSELASSSQLQAGVGYHPRCFRQMGVSNYNLFKGQCSKLIFFKKL